MAGWADLALHWQFHPLAAAALAGYALTYRCGLARLSGPPPRPERRPGRASGRRRNRNEAGTQPSRGRRNWPTSRKLAFAGTLLAATVATQSGIARYEHESFTVHMVQHTLLALVVPLLVVLSAPVTLALQTAPPRMRRRLRTVLRSPLGHTLAHPLVGWVLFGGGLVAVYLTPLLDLAARSGRIHLAVHTHMVLAGVLFLTPLIGTDAITSRLSYPARLLVLLAAVPFHTVVALALVSAISPVAPRAYPDLDQQHEAAAIFWGSGELLTLTAAAIIVRRWWLADQRATHRETRADNATASAYGILPDAVSRSRA